MLNEKGLGVTTETQGCIHDDRTVANDAWPEELEASI
jgi:hypothetical protein